MIKKALLVVALSFSLALSAHAGSFNVMPVKIVLNEKTKVDNLTIRNEAAEAVTVHVKVFEWSQDEKGADVYLPTTDVVYLPRVLTISGKEERKIKIGYDKKAPASEKTYRIYVEEVPQAAPGGEGAQLRMTLRMGVPIFVAPRKKGEPRADVADAKIAGGRLSFAVKNLGNSYIFEKNVKVTGLAANNKAGFSEARQGWYVLSGKTKLHTVDIPADACSGLQTVNIEVDLEKINLKKTIDVDKEACLRSAL